MCCRQTGLDVHRLLSPICHHGAWRLVSLRAFSRRSRARDRMLGTSGRTCSRAQSCPLFTAPPARRSHCRFPSPAYHPDLRLRLRLRPRSYHPVSLTASLTHPIPMPTRARHVAPSSSRKARPTLPLLPTHTPAPAVGRLALALSPAASFINTRVSRRRHACCTCL